MVETNDVSEIEVDSVTLNGRTTQCFGQIVEYGFYYGTDPAVSKKVTVGVNEYLAIPFSKNISSMKPGLYYYKAFATNAAGTGYGTLNSFEFLGSGLEPKIKVNLDGQNLIFDVEPIVVEGRTLVPLRTIFEALGANVQWYQDTQTVKAEKSGNQITLVIDGNAFINGILTPLDVAARIVNGRTLVPLRFVSEAMGCQVEWINTSRTVIIKSSRN